VLVLNSAFTWYPFTMTYALSVICSVPLGVTRLEEILVIKLSSFCLVLNTFLGAPLSKCLAFG
jgi:hypothetical protein